MTFVLIFLEFLLGFSWRFIWFLTGFFFSKISTILPWNYPRQSSRIPEFRRSFSWGPYRISSLGFPSIAPRVIRRFFSETLSGFPLKWYSSIIRCSSWDFSRWSVWDFLWLSFVQQWFLGLPLKLYQSFLYEFLRFFCRSSLQNFLRSSSCNFFKKFS